MKKLNLTDLTQEELEKLRQGNLKKKVEYEIKWYWFYKKNNVLIILFLFSKNEKMGLSA